MVSAMGDMGIHNRTPAMLSEEAEALWLDPMTEDPEVLQ